MSIRTGVNDNYYCYFINITIFSTVEQRKNDTSAQRAQQFRHGAAAAAAAGQLNAFLLLLRFSFTIYII